MIEAVHEQTTHRQALERRVIESNILSERIGQIFSLVVAAAALGSGTWLIHEGQGPYGISIVVGDGAAIALAFLQGQRAQGRELRKHLNPFAQPPDQ
jgi:hypothetical protein